MSTSSKEINKDELFFCQNDIIQVFSIVNSGKFHISDWFCKIALVLVQRLREVDQKTNRTVDVNASHPIAAVTCLVAAANQNIRSGNFKINCKFFNNIADLLYPQSSFTKSFWRA